MTLVIRGIILSDLSDCEMKKSTKIIRIMAISICTLLVIFVVIQVRRFNNFGKPSLIPSDTTVVGEVIDTANHDLYGDTSSAENYER